MSEDCCPRYISKQCIHWRLARDCEAKSDRATCILVHTTARYCRKQNSLIGQDSRIECVSHRSSQICSSEKLFLTISMMWKCIHGKFLLQLVGKLTNASLPEENQKASNTWYPSASATTFQTLFFLSATSELCQTAHNKLVLMFDHPAINMT